MASTIFLERQQTHNFVNSELSENFYFRGCEGCVHMDSSREYSKHNSILII